MRKVGRCLDVHNFDPRFVWRPLTVSALLVKDTPPETSRLNAFGDPSKALITARQVLSKYAEKKGFAFSIVA